MAGRQNTSFLKRQKEQKRADKATAKRAARQARRDEKAASNVEELVVEPAEREPDPDPVPE